MKHTTFLQLIKRETREVIKRGTREVIKRVVRENTKVDLSKEWHQKKNKRLLYQKTGDRNYKSCLFLRMSRGINRKVSRKKKSKEWRKKIHPLTLPKNLQRYYQKSGERNFNRKSGERRNKKCNKSYFSFRNNGSQNDHRSKPTASSIVLGLAKILCPLIPKCC